MPASPKNTPFDRKSWQAWLDRHSGQFAGIASGSRIGLVRAGDFATGEGPMLVWEASDTGMNAADAAFKGFEDAAGVEVLLVLDAEAEAVLCREGLDGAPHLMSGGHMRLYVLKAREALEESGLDEFLDGLGLMFPRH